jgi:hypothetical protein
LRGRFSELIPVPADESWRNEPSEIISFRKLIPKELGHVPKTNTPVSDFSN